MAMELEEELESEDVVDTDKNYTDTVKEPLMLPTPARLLLPLPTPACLPLLLPPPRLSSATPSVE